MEQREITAAEIDKVRDAEGFPIATDEAIVELSDAPYYTACPNPFIEEFVAEYGSSYNEDRDDYHNEPFASDVSEGKNDPIYKAHAYHTKVPYKAIMRYILHYTNPGDIVFDGFCGTGMTGIAAQMCATADSSVRYEIESEFKPELVQWGLRRAILGDLSPAATSIAANYNASIDIEELESELDIIYRRCQEECAWLYETRHVLPHGRSQLLEGQPPVGHINNVIWSDILLCPSCGETFDFWNTAIDHEGGSALDAFKCPHCGAILKKDECERLKEIVYDDALGKTISMARQKPVVINYTYMGKRYSKEPDAFDFELLERIKQYKIKDWYPHDRMPDGRESRRNDQYGITHVHHFYTKRNLICLAVLNRLIEESQVKQLRFLLTGLLIRSTKMNRVHIKKYFFGGGGWNGGNLAGTLYVSSTPVETSVLEQVKDRSANIRRVFSSYKNTPNGVIITTQSLTDTNNIPRNSIDYIFTDPPFGDNLNYSELSFIWEAWLRVFTSSSEEAIINPVQNKGLSEYQSLMERCFANYYDVLKPGRWITIEFHNSKNAVWNAIQEALQRSGFIVADVRTLDKRQGSFKQVNSTSAVKQDLVISAYKPKESFKKALLDTAGSEDTAWSFVQQHLANLPIVVINDNQIEVVAERQAYLLYDRMVAYHVMQGIPIPLGAAEFYKGLEARFIKRDDMYFLPNQITEFDIARLKLEVHEIEFALYVTNEKTAIGWLYQLLSSNPQTYAEIQPKFMLEVKKIDRYEAMPELAILLEENFLQDESGHWYVPDTKKEGDVFKLREKSLLREFNGYLKSGGELKLFRSEAIRVGFSHLWREKNYQAIVDLAKRLPAVTIQEDPSLLMYVDLSQNRVG